MPEASDEKTGSCLCGGLQITVKGAPAQTNICSCEACQKRSGSAFTYTAFFPEENVAIKGDYKTWRREAHSGGHHDCAFCPECGCSVFTRLGVVPGVVAVAAGCFADPALAQPERFFWTETRHHWLSPIDGVEDMQRQ